MRRSTVFKATSVSLILLAALIVGDCRAESAAATGKPRIAVMRAELGEDLRPSLGIFLYDMLLDRAVSTGRYIVVDGEEVVRVMQHVSKAQPGISLEEARKVAVSQLGIQRMYVASLVKVGEEYHISFRVLNSDLTVYRVVRGSVDQERKFEALIDEMAVKLTATPEGFQQIKREDEAWATAQGEDTELAYERFLAAFPESRCASEAEARAKERALPFKVEMVFVKGGTFPMGSPPEEKYYSADEGPVHEVELRDFYLGKYEVTFEQFDAYCDEIGRPRPDDKNWGRGERPVIDVSWDNIVPFLRWLNSLTGRNYRLPTEAEWEYACRAGTTTSRSFGDDVSKLGQYAWYDANTRVRTLRVGRKLPNPWGLHDMYGNLWEWCADWYGKDYYSVSPRLDPKGPADGAQRVLRGGSWDNAAGSLRSATRLRATPDTRSRRIGFRLARDP